MKRIYLLAVLMAFGVGVEAKKVDVVIDAEYAKTQAQEEKAVKEQCGHIKNNFKRWDCADEIYDAFRADGVIRGTEEYCQKHYFTLDTKPLFDKYLELGELKKKARFSAIRPGEVTTDDLKSEQNYIKQELINRWKKAHKDPWVEWHKLADDGVVIKE
jgi:hypothetical protein